MIAMKVNGVLGLPGKALAFLGSSFWLFYRYFGATSGRMRR
jgi:hypothetical protein